MGLLKVHESLESKKKLINNTSEITTHQDFDLFYNNFKDKKNHIYRGVGDSNFMLYNSAQRFWILNEMDNWNVPYHVFIKKYIDKVKIENNETVKNYFKNFVQDADDLAVMSLIQHNGGPTPLLDFTESVGVAFYFACHSSKAISSNKELDSYISIYVIGETDKDVFKAPIDLDRKEIKAALDDGRIPLDNMPQIVKQFKIYQQHIFSRPMLILEKDENDLGLTFGIYSNLNISNQKGLFLYSNDSTKPLEEQIHSNKVFQEYSNPSEILNCMHFHKSLIPYIKQKIRDDGITDDFIFPKAENIVQTSLNSLMTNPNLGSVY